MFSFLLHRFYQAVLVMLVISFIAFLIQDTLGDPLSDLVGISTSEVEREKLREELGLNDPFMEQYLRFLANALRGDFGISYFFKLPVLEVILSRLPATLELVICATIIILLVSFPVGLFAGLRPDHFFSKLSMFMSLIGISIPVFLTGIFLIYIFPISLGFLYSFGRGNELVEVFPFWQTGFLSMDGLLHLVLPSVTLSSIMLPMFIRLIRSETMEVLGSEYIRFARARGLSFRRILFVHVLKNILLPVISVGGVQIGVMIAYTIFTEKVFQWPGMGFMFLEAVNRNDTPLIVAYLIFVGLIFTVVNTLVDLLYLLVNPTLKLNG